MRAKFLFVAWGTSKLVMLLQLNPNILLLQDNYQTDSCTDMKNPPPDLAFNCPNTPIYMGMEGR